MEFTALATKRLGQYTFLPSKKKAKYTEVYQLYLKAADSYLHQALSSPSTSSSLLSLAAESFLSAAHVASRKLRSPPTALSAYLEAALAYHQAECFPLSYDALRKAIEQRDLCTHRPSPTPPSTSPTSARPPAPTGRLKGRRSSDAGPTRQPSRTSQSLPASPVLSSRTPPLPPTTAPTSPHLPAPAPGLVSRMRRLMVRTDKTAGGKPPLQGTDVSPLPPLQLPVPVVPVSPNRGPRSTSPFPAPAVHGPHLAVPGGTPATGPPSPVDAGPGVLALGRVPTTQAALVEPRLSLQVVGLAVALGYALWDEGQGRSALEAFEIGLGLLAGLEEGAGAMEGMGRGRRARVVVSAHAATLYLMLHTLEVEGKVAWECDLRLLQRARDLFVQTVRLQAEMTASPGEDTQAPEGEDLIAGLGKSPLPDCLSPTLPPTCAVLFSACLCDAIVQAYTGGFHERVLNTPPFLCTSLRLSPAFFDTVECKFVRQMYGLLQLSSSAPARLLDHANAAPLAASSPEEHYRRLLLTMWGNEILNEFVLLLTRFLYTKRGLPQPPPPLSPTSAAKERGEEGKVHPLVLMGGLVKDETEEWGRDELGEAVDGQGMQLLLKVKRIMRQNISRPGFRYTP